MMLFILEIVQFQLVQKLLKSNYVLTKLKNLLIVNGICLDKIMNFVRLPSKLNMSPTP